MTTLIASAAGAPRTLLLTFKVPLVPIFSWAVPGNLSSQVTTKDHLSLNLQGEPLQHRKLNRTSAKWTLRASQSTAPPDHRTIASGLIPQLGCHCVVAVGTC